MRSILGQLRRMSTRSITLNTVETKFVTLLDEFAQRYQPPVECRIAGGWVRDKLLSKPSVDLDIALSIPSGYQFAVAFVSHLKTKDVVVGSVGKVAANPEQSKHLETGTTRIMGLECDFVGLRSETYADSRIPEKVELGTPFEDASRRDLTINSLFYNVHTKQVEDFTKMGLVDLEQGIARTPLPPRQTFHDDPLRILRCVRFASRFSLSIAKDVEEAIRAEDVKDALLHKVSKERIGIEVTKMMHHDPYRAICLIDSLGLHPSIFSSDVVIPSRHDALATGQILHHLQTHFNLDERLWLAAAISPFRDYTIRQKKEVPAVSVVLSECLKLSNDIKTSVTNLFSTAPLLDPKLRHKSRATIGLVLQATRPWEMSFTWAIVMAILPNWTGTWNQEAEAVFKEYLLFKDCIIQLGLPISIESAPLLNGKEILSLLGLSPSPLLQVIVRAINAWQLDHPSATPEDCRRWLKHEWENQGRTEWESSVPKTEKPDKEKGEKRKKR